MWEKRWSLHCHVITRHAKPAAGVIRFWITTCLSLLVLETPTSQRQCFLEKASIRGRRVLAWREREREIQERERDVCSVSQSFFPGIGRKGFRNQWRIYRSRSGCGGGMAWFGSLCFIPRISEMLVTRVPKQPPTASVLAYSSVPPPPPITEWVQDVCRSACKLGSSWWREYGFPINGRDLFSKCRDVRGKGELMLVCWIMMMMMIVPLFCIG